MTPDMAFECLLVSQDPAVVCPLNEVLDRLSISTKVCLTPSKAIGELDFASTDLVVIDWTDDSSSGELLSRIYHSDFVHKKTIVAVTEHDSYIRGTHVVLSKPITTESGEKCLRSVYDRMLIDYRQHARYAVMIPVIATNQDNRLLPVTITNVGDGGMGLSAKEGLSRGDVLSFRLTLPDTRRSIYVEARVLWTRDYGVCGCQFVRVPPVDLDILHEWLKAKCQVKKPSLPRDHISDIGRDSAGKHSSLTPRSS